MLQRRGMLLKQRLSATSLFVPVPELSHDRSISRVIYQTYPSKDVPTRIHNNIQFMKDLNPSYKYELFDDSDIADFIVSEYGRSIYSYYERINPKYGAARADFFRYLLIYKCGGVYLDIKSSILKPLDDILRKDDQYLLAQWTNPTWRHRELAAIPGGEFQNWHIIAVRGHPFLKRVIDSVMINIDNYRPWLHGVGKGAVNRTTGPIAYTLAIFPIIDAHPRRIEKSDDELSLQYSILGGDAHTQLFASHYSLIEESVVTLTGSAGLFANLYTGARRVAKGIVHAWAKSP
jgi:mannosyltransferase OCH1-like enzyme